MSLEQAITDHASALRELAAAIRATVGAGVADVATAAAAHQVISDAKAQSSAATKPQAQTVVKSVEEAKKQEAATPLSVSPTNTSTAAPAPTYDDVKAKVLALSKEKGREPTVQLLQRHGVAKAPDLKPEQYADFIADIDAIMAGTYNPEAAEV